MAKRKLTRQQAWRIEKIQAERIKRQQKREASIEALTSDQQLGPETSGTIIANFGAQLIVEIEDGEHIRCIARQNLETMVCGDQVIWQSTGEQEGVITALLSRDTILARPRFGGEAKAVAANIDQILIFSAVVPRLKTQLIDRYLVACEIAGISAKLVFNKVDLLGPEQHVIHDEADKYKALGYPVLLLSTKQKIGIDTLKSWLHDKTSILVGQSGVGKSSTINMLLPSLDIQVGELSTSSELGKHTTSSTRLYHLEDKGSIIDSPGIRDFGLWHLPEDKIAWGFVEFRDYLGQCKFSDCTHTHEPECALLQAIEDEKIFPERLEHFHRIMDLVREHRDD